MFVLLLFRSKIFGSNFANAYQKLILKAITITDLTLMSINLFGFIVLNVLSLPE